MYNDDNNNNNKVFGFPFAKYSVLDFCSYLLLKIYVFYFLWIMLSLGIER